MTELFRTTKGPALPESHVVIPRLPFDALTLQWSRGWFVASFALMGAAITLMFIIYGPIQPQCGCIRGIYPDQLRGSIWRGGLFGRSRFRQNFLTESTQRNTYSGIFGHDEWRLFPNVLVSYGLRYERESIILDRNNFAPRFSVAYDPFNSGKTVLRFGAGLFYNRALLRTIDDFTLGTRQLFFDTNSLRDPDSGKLMSVAQRRAFIATNLRFPQTLTVDSPLVAQFGELNTEFSRRLDPRLRIPESYQANLGVERDLGWGLVFEANYTLNRGIHLWREFNANAPVLPAGFNDFSEYLALARLPQFSRAARHGIAHSTTPRQQGS